MSRREERHSGRRKSLLCPYTHTHPHADKWNPAKCFSPNWCDLIGSERCDTTTKTACAKKAKMNTTLGNALRKEGQCETTTNETGGFGKHGVTRQSESTSRTSYNTVLGGLPPPPTWSGSIKNWAQNKRPPQSESRGVQTISRPKKFSNDRFSGASTRLCFLWKDDSLGPGISHRAQPNRYNARRYQKSFLRRRRRPARERARLPYFPLFT